MDTATELKSMQHHLGGMLRTIQRTNKGKRTAVIAFALESHLKALTPAQLGLAEVPVEVPASSALSVPAEEPRAA